MFSYWRPYAVWESKIKASDLEGGLMKKEEEMDQLSLPNTELYEKVGQKSS